jgi:hypothetical protein
VNQLVTSGPADEIRQLQRCQPDEGLTGTNEKAEKRELVAGGLQCTEGAGSVIQVQVASDWHS